MPLDPFAKADEDTGETKQTQNYIHIRIQRTSLAPRPRTGRPHVRSSFRPPDAPVTRRLARMLTCRSLQSVMDVKL